MISYRFGTTEDIASVMAVMDTAFDPRFGEAWTAAQCKGIFSLPGISLILAFADRVSAGFALSRVVLDEAELLLLAVRPEYRRQGIAADLLARAAESVRIMGAEHFHLEVRDGNQAISLYSQWGFKQIGRRRAYYRGRDGTVFDALSLSISLHARNIAQDMS